MGGEKYGLSLLSHELRNQPLESIAPVNQVQMAHAHKRPLVAGIPAPFATSNAYQPVVRAFSFLENAIRLVEYRPKAWLERSPV